MLTIGRTERTAQLNRLELVKRSFLLRILATCLITVPLAGVLAAMCFFMMRGVMLP